MVNVCHLVKQSAKPLSFLFIQLLFSHGFRVIGASEVTYEEKSPRYFISLLFHPLFGRDDTLLFPTNILCHDNMHVHVRVLFHPDDITHIYHRYDTALAILFCICIGQHVYFIACPKFSICNVTPPAHKLCSLYVMRHPN